MANIKRVMKEAGKLNLTEGDADAQQLPDISLILCLSQQLGITCQNQINHRVTVKRS